MSFPSVFLGEILNALLEIPSCKACELGTIFRGCHLWRINTALSAPIARLHLQCGRLLWVDHDLPCSGLKNLTLKKGSDINPQCPRLISGQIATVTISNINPPSIQDTAPTKLPRSEFSKSSSQQPLTATVTSSQPTSQHHGSLSRPQSRTSSRPQCATNNCQLYILMAASHGYGHGHGSGHSHRHFHGHCLPLATANFTSSRQPLTVMATATVCHQQLASFTSSWKSFMATVTVMVCHQQLASFIFSWQPLMVTATALVTLRYQQLASFTTSQLSLAAMITDTVMTMVTASAMAMAKALVFTSCPRTRPPL